MDTQKFERALYDPGFPFPDSSSLIAAFEASAQAHLLNRLLELYH